MNLKKVKLNRAQRRNRVRTKIKVYSKDKPRLSVFRSNKHFYCQLIDISQGKVLLFSSDLKFSSGKRIREKLSQIALKMGQDFGKKMIEKGIKEAVFDRSFYKFHGIVKNFVQGLKEVGINI